MPARTQPPPGQITTDAELVAAIQRGDRSLLSSLYDRYEQRVYNKCLGLVKDRQTAQDLTHDIFIKVFTNIGKYQGKADFSYWMYAITYNHCMTHLRRANNNPLGLLDENEEVTDDGDRELTAKMLKEMRLNHLEQLLNMIKPQEKLILLMRYQDGMSIRQIGQVLSVGESAVKMRLKRCRDHLATLLDKPEEL